MSHLMGRYTSLAALALLLALPSCATAGKGAKAAGKLAVKGTVIAASVPLEDLNIKREKIPDELRRVDTIYPEVPPETCFMVDFEIRELDRVLSPDEDDPTPVSSLSFRDKMTERAERSAVDAMRDAAGSAFDDGMENLAGEVLESTIVEQVPFRSAVRHLSGAERHVKKRNEAYIRGLARRTYLKGLGDAMGCTDARVNRELYAEDEKKKRFLGIF